MGYVLPDFILGRDHATSMRENFTAPNEGLGGFFFDSRGHGDRIN
jgi:hypothetical protein